MDFDFSEEQRLLKESVDRFIGDRYDFEQRKTFAKSDSGYAHENWKQFAELGLLAIPFAEEHGGFGGGPTETMIVMEAFGRGLVLEPYFSTVVLGGGLLRHAGSDAHKSEFIPKIASGDLRLAFAHGERQSRYDLADVEARAKKSGSGYLLEGEKSLVLNGDSADTLIVSARMSGDERDRSGIGLFLVDGNAKGVSRRGYPTQDGLRAAEISLSGVEVPVDRVLSEDGLPIIERVVDEAIAALAAEAVGAMAEMHALTVDYLKTRKQFGVAIGAFQALQHRAVDMFVALEQARSMAMFATMMSAEDDAEARSRATSAAKVQIGRSAKIVGQGAIQLHGGVGMTMELKVGHYFKRATMIDVLFGDADYHLARLAEAGSLAA
ncbi:MAG: acyl-CoA dehydrogenase family protein [Methylobacteriaceae bacterium]|nr:acyl-CoA dehydrogenase family protein [Methylobacteriaceae bacterium]